MKKNSIKSLSIQPLLFEAVFYDNLEQAKYAITNGADVNALVGDAFTVQQRQSYLFIASYKGNEAMVKLLLQHGAHIDHTTSDGSTALLVACQQGHLSIVKELVIRKAKINFSDNDGETPLFVAAGFGNEEIMSLLLDNGALINNPNLNERGATPLFIACQRGHLKAVELLLSRGAAIDQARKSDGLSPLQIAVLCGHTAIVKLLIKSQASLSHKNSDGLTASQLAQANGLKAMQVLLTPATVIPQKNETTTTSTTSTAAPAATSIVTTSVSPATSYYTDVVSSNSPSNLLWTNPATITSQGATQPKENDDEQAEKNSKNQLQQ